MRRLQQWCIISSLLLMNNQAMAQTAYPKNYFRSPVDTVLRLIGNFGELRNIHFHAGIDIRTNSHEGMEIKAIGDGYVSRMKVSSYGYGKVLYITHPNGYTSVYAHLLKYNDAIGAYMRKAQYEKEEFEVEVFPKQGELNVKKGDVIAYSGNTGGSTGPHLHFEIRDTKTEAAINPLLFGLEVEDKARPILTGIFAYTLDENSTINGAHHTKPFPLLGKKSGITTVHGNIGFAIDGYDKESYSAGKNGIYSIELRLDGKKIYSHVMEKIPFEDSRYINCHIDYAVSRTVGRNIQRSFLLKNNNLGIYKDVVNRGIVKFLDDSIHTLTYILKDIYGNSSTASFKVKSVSKTGLVKKEAPAITALFKWDAPNKYENTKLRLQMSPGILYEDLPFRYSTSPKPAAARSVIHHVSNELIPVHSAYTLAIKPDNVPERLGTKAVIAHLNDNHGRSIDSSRWENGWVVTRTRILGDFIVKVDTIPPLLSPMNIGPGKRMKGNTIAFRTHDNMTGVKKIRATIDGKWVLMEYEHKKNLLYYTFDKTVTPGKHHFKLEVSDGRNNKRTYQCDFIR